MKDESVIGLKASQYLLFSLNEEEVQLFGGHVDTARGLTLE